MAILVMVCIFCLAFAAGNVGGIDTKTGFFVFGDSYADTGNSINSSVVWDTPYGITWPGHPSGRFSNGKVETDILARALGLPLPTPFKQFLNSTAAGIGINFAVGGAGVTYAYGIPDLHTQVGWFKSVLQSGYYSKSFLKDSSVGFVCIVGNDYGAFNQSIKRMIPFARLVVRRITYNLELLYHLGLRNIMVSSLTPLNCVPVQTYISNFTECTHNDTIKAVLRLHNFLLEKSLTRLGNKLQGVNFIYLDTTKAVTHIQANTVAYGLSTGFRPCCLGSCAYVDLKGNPLYTVCEEPQKHLFWDSIHPTQGVWEAIVELYTSGKGFTKPGPNLAQWAGLHTS